MYGKREYKGECPIDISDVCKVDSVLREKKRNFCDFINPLWTKEKETKLICLSI